MYSLMNVHNLNTLRLRHNTSTGIPDDLTVPFSYYYSSLKLFKTYFLKIVSGIFHTVAIFEYAGNNISDIRDYSKFHSKITIFFL